MLVKDAARIDAEHVLAAYWDGRFPVNPYTMARKLGYRVRVGTLVDNLSGAVIATSDRDITLLIEKSLPFGQQNFAFAHETGHVAERKRTGYESYSFKERRVGTIYDGHEFYADEFARNLLMPERAFRNVMDEYDSDRVAAGKFGVAPSAVRQRRERLKI